MNCAKCPRALAEQVGARAASGLKSDGLDERSQTFLLATGGASHPFSPSRFHDVRRRPCRRRRARHGHRHRSWSPCDSSHRCRNLYCCDWDSACWSGPPSRGKGLPGPALLARGRQTLTCPGSLSIPGCAYGIKSSRDLPDPNRRPCRRLARPGTVPATSNSVWSAASFVGRCAPAVNSTSSLGGSTAPAGGKLASSSPTVPNLGLVEPPDEF